MTYRTAYRRSFPVVLIALAGIISLSGCLVSQAEAETKLPAREVTLEVGGFAWQRTVWVENYRTVSLEAWEDELPEDARRVSCKDAIRSYNRVIASSRQVPETYTERVPCGTEYYPYGKRKHSRTKYCTETKTRTRTENTYRDEPVYDCKVTYETERWIEEPAFLHGLTFNPRWPQVKANSKTSRITGRTEGYFIDLAVVGEPKRAFSIEATSTTWRLYQPGAKFKAQIDAHGNLLWLENLPSG